MSMQVPGPIMRARRIAGGLLISAAAIVIVGGALLLNWYLNRTPTL